MPKSMRMIAFCFLSSAVVVSVFGLAGCGGGDAQHKEAQQASQETNQPAPQPTSPTPAQSSSRLASELIGTWELTHLQGTPLGPPPGGHNARMTFSDDGILEIEEGSYNQGGSAAESKLLAPLLEYRVLDDSRILLTNPEDGESFEQEYSLEGDTLTLYNYLVDDPEVPVEHTWQRNTLRIQGQLGLARPIRDR